MKWTCKLCRFSSYNEKFSERQIQAEFQRIVTTDLLSSFLDGLDGLAPTLLEVHKGASRTGKKPALKSILDCLEKDDTNERRRTAALWDYHTTCLAKIRQMSSGCVMLMETLEEAVKGMQVGLLIGYEVSSGNEIFIRVSPEGGYEDTARPSLCQSTWTQK
ncbi:Phosphoribosylglycinamide formyltransferase [Dissostichus eleginoides]|uniref:Phosphoribosylglycinamide formyltransferase n=1 Tax=Dissostichus eleginoides TaxID=100907 RepID=A0AAD9CLI2_DISEL|nr:Phosphoribosylglycinamide formyltransferase [Dissostichus eleginoides]